MSKDVDVASDSADPRPTDAGGPSGLPPQWPVGAATDRRFEATQALAHIGIFIIDNATDAVWFSDELRRITGIGPSEPVPTRDEMLRMLFDVNDRDVLDAAQRAVEQQGPVTVEASFRHRSGEMRDVVIHGDRDERDGELVGVWGTAQDITDLRFGGDWYDVFRLDERRLVLVVGDIAGHGIGAVAAMATLRNALRAYGYAVEAPGAALAALNEFVLRSGLDTMATALYAIYETTTRELSWSHAGHPPPLLVGPEGATLLERDSGPPIGVGHRRFDWTEHHAEIPPGSLLLLYTDGLIERRDEHLDEGLARLGDAATALHRRTGPIARRLRDEVALDHTDDICILAVRTPA